ncbi:Ohr family peroxiredoxin [Pseudoxanthomonas indica]|uniref:Peroxiredoxin, Ohr subfamily n=1 Tax=Pseudoxanthomonas indica TaxID=428993 RepID=A0A1T5LVY0_9GAMM|nr:Ohr family peroxiredoxin [Pseudoxanthomonas indica]GGD40600.1 peroxiredoxin [Pseudoxanthomonas indica]SKC80102.1 peroxiredoxin, Ohr subfamily [Pseudoxanthomonas indica]
MTALLPPPREWLDKYFGDETKALYTGRVRVTGGEAGHGRASGVVRSDDGALDVCLRLPVEMGGPGGGSNPEQLLAAAYAACFHGALNLYASRMGVATRDVSVDAAVTFARDPVDGLFLLSAEIRVTIPGLNRGVAAELIRNTERICPYAKMFRHGVEHVVILVDEAA